MRRLAAPAVVACLINPVLAWAQSPVVTRCTGPAGHGYFFPGSLVKGKDVGWTKEAITNGQFLVMRDKEGAYDIVFTDSMNRTISARGDGGQVIAVHDAGGRLILLVNYAQVNIETWMFLLDERGTGTLTMSQARYGEGALIQKHSLMAASCRR